MTPTINWIVKTDTTIDDLLQEAMFSESLRKKIIKENCIYCNNVLYKLNTILKANDHIAVILPEEETTINCIEGKLNIVYEDDYLLIVDKPNNIPVIGTRAHYDYHLSGIVANYFKSKNLKSTIHLVNRLDLETSGLVMFAKHQYIHGLFAKKDFKIKKHYYALVEGILDKKQGIIDAPILKVGTQMKRVIDSLGQSAQTAYQVIDEKNGRSLVDIELLTGRTHQIRIHFSYINHPLVGDSLYGNSNSGVLLQSYGLYFIHPIFLTSLHFELKCLFSV